MERYIVFIRKMDTGEEFVSAHMAESNNHEIVLSAIRQKYPSPNYMVHTTYTEDELGDILESMNRWCGDAAINQTTKAGSVTSFRN